MTRVVVAAAAALLAAGVAASGAGGSARPLRVGLLLWSGPASAMNRNFEAGYARAVRTFRWEGEVHEVGPRDSVNDGIAFFVRQHYDLIVLGILHPLIVQIVDAAVKRFPHTRFLLPDVGPLQRRASWREVHSYGFRVEQAAFLAGYIGGLMEKKRSGRHVVSSVSGFPEPSVMPFVGGYRAGARKADRAVTAVNDYSYDFNAPHKCHSIALEQIGRGSGVVFDIAGECGLGALQAAKEKGVWGIGVDTDESALGPFVLTSVLKHEGRALYLELSAYARGKLAPSGFEWFGYREGAVGLGKISPRVPGALVAKLHALEAQVASGKVAVRPA
jgi:basic membrane protein A